MPHKLVSGAGISIISFCISIEVSASQELANIITQPIVPVPKYTRGAFHEN